jgi:predicted transcriptional regulator
MNDLSDGSIRTMSDINENEEVSKLLTAETRFVEMEEVEKAAKDYLLKQKTEFLVRESKDNPLQELQNEIIHEADEFAHEAQNGQHMVTFIFTDSFSDLIY